MSFKDAPSALEERPFLSLPEEPLQTLDRLTPADLASIGNTLVPDPRPD